MEKKGKGHSKEEDKSDSKGGGKPDFLDLDKDGDKKESMKKAKDKKIRRMNECRRVPWHMMVLTSSK